MNMIFVTVGTHEQPFDRLIREIDRLKGTGEICCEVMIQTGYCSYRPVNCSYSQWLTPAEMSRYTEEAHIVITHGGPSSFLAVVSAGKVPIVVPRRKQYGEHVNDHQFEFANKVAERYGNILVAADVKELGRMIADYDKLTETMNTAAMSNNRKFVRDFEALIGDLMNTASKRRGTKKRGGER